jgi:hypothetical protein
MSATESQIMTNIIADPAVRTTVKEKHARVRQDVCRVVVPASPGAGELLRLTKLKAHDVITSVKRIGDADANMSDCNLGIYVPSDDTTDPTLPSGLTSSTLSDATNLAAIAEAPTEFLGDGLTNPEDFGKELWEYAGIAAADEPDVGTEYEIVLEIVGDAVGSDQTFIIQYTHGD